MRTSPARSASGSSTNARCDPGPSSPTVNRALRATASRRDEGDRLTVAQGRPARSPLAKVDRLVATSTPRTGRPCSRRRPTARAQRRCRAARGSAGRRRRSRSRRRSPWRRPTGARAGRRRAPAAASAPAAGGFALASLGEASRADNRVANSPVRSAGGRGSRAKPAQSAAAPSRRQGECSIVAEPRLRVGGREPVAARGAALFQHRSDGAEARRASSRGRRARSRRWSAPRSPSIPTPSPTSGDGNIKLAALPPPSGAGQSR